LYSSPNIRIYQIKKAEMGGKENKNTYRVLVSKTEGTTWKSRRRWESNIKMELKEKLGKDVEWIHPAQEKCGFL
jgi:hypothetical protein